MRQPDASGGSDTGGEYEAGAGGERHLGKARPTVQSLSRAQRRHLAGARRNSRVAKRAERALAGHLRAVFERTRTQLVDAVGTQLGKALLGLAPPSRVAPSLAKEVADDVHRLLASLDLSDWAVLVTPTERLLAAMATDGATTGLERLGLDASLFSDTVNADVADFAATRAAELVGMRVLPDGTLVPSLNPDTAITEATRDLVRDTVTQAFTDGWSRDTLAERLQDAYAFSDQRADLIARTEISNAQIQGSLTGWRASGVVTQKQWILGSEHDRDDECDAAAGDGPVPLEATFSSGDDAPPAHPNCTCDLIALTEPASDTATSDLPDVAVADDTAD